MEAEGHIWNWTVWNVTTQQDLCLMFFTETPQILTRCNYINIYAQCKVEKCHRTAGLVEFKVVSIQQKNYQKLSGELACFSHNEIKVHNKQKIVSSERNQPLITWNRKWKYLKFSLHMLLVYLDLVDLSSIIKAKKYSGNKLVSIGMIVSIIHGYVLKKMI